MAFPATYNINYYQGDLYEFNIYPKDSTGAAFNLDGYSAKFYIATARGTGATQYECNVSIVNNVVVCQIPGGVGKSLTAGTTYVYDVQIKKTIPGPEDVITGADKIYTLLTGNVTVTADVTRMSGD
jgi:hypothetical protein